jgi:hypothetical protein
VNDTGKSSINMGMEYKKGYSPAASRKWERVVIIVVGGENVVYRTRLLQVETCHQGVQS